MKTLLLLLVCLAAANAASFNFDSNHCGYVRWNIRRYYTFPCFRYRINFRQSWCSTKYYKSVLTSYPGKKCTTRRFREWTQRKFTRVIKRRLSISAKKIHKKMKATFKKWNTKVCVRLSAAQRKYKRSVNKYTRKYLRFATRRERIRILKLKKKAIAKYNKTSTKMYKRAVKSYKKTMARMFSTVKKFHKKLRKVSLRCFKTRKTRISKYKKSLKKRMGKFVRRYKKVMKRIVTKRVTIFKKLLTKVHCSKTWKRRDVRKVIKIFRRRETRAYMKKASAYSRKLKKATARLVKNYRCAYQCTTYSGALCFRRRRYYRTCRRLRYVWRFKTGKWKSFRLITYKFKYRPMKFKKLRKCNTRKVNISAKKFKKNLQKKRNKRVAGAWRKYRAWKKRAEKRNKAALKKYKKIIDKRHKVLRTYWRSTWLCRGQRRTRRYWRSYAAYKRTLKRQKKKAVKKYKKMLAKRLNRASKFYKRRIASYKKMVNRLITRVVKGYKRCLSTRTKRINKYRKRLLKLRKRMRTRLSKRLTKIYNRRVKQYAKLMKFHTSRRLRGAARRLYRAYKSKAKKMSKKVLAKFDKDWRKRISKFTRHYACSYKCTYRAKFSVPKIRVTFKYRICMPTYKVYRYQYRRFCTYRRYRLIRRNGCWRYILRAY